MHSLSLKYNTTHLTTRSLAKQVYYDLLKLPPTEQVLDFSDIDFASRSFMVQLYSMLASHQSQARFINMNESINNMYHLAVSAWNRPSVLPSDFPAVPGPQVMHL